MTYDEAYRAIKHGRTEILAEAIPSTLDPNAANRFGWTLLMAAAHEGNTTIGRLLLDRGADVAPLNDFGESALSLAAHKGHLPFVKLLKARGRRPTFAHMESSYVNGSRVPRACRRSKLMPFWLLPLAPDRMDYSKTANSSEST
jgi:ankyrin repeat protein